MSKQNKIPDIITIITNDYNTTLDEVKSSSQRGSVLECRHIIHYYLKKKKKLSLKSIGKITNRSKTSVYNSVQVIEGYRTIYKNLNDRIANYLLT